MKRPGFFDVEELLARLSRLGDQFEAFSRTVDFEMFRPDLDKVPAYANESKSRRPQLDPVLIFKILVSQTLNNLPNERPEYQRLEGGSAERLHSRELAGQAVKAVAQGPPSPLDAEIHESKMAGGWDHAHNRSCHPVLWL